MRGGCATTATGRCCGRSCPRRWRDCAHRCCEPSREPTEARARAPGGTATGPAPRLDCRPPRPRIRFMVWLYLLFALAAFAVEPKSTSLALAVDLLLAALGFLGLVVLGRAEARTR